MDKVMDPDTCMFWISEVVGGAMQMGETDVRVCRSSSNCRRSTLARVIIDFNNETFQTKNVHFCRSDRPHLALVPNPPLEYNEEIQTKYFENLVALPHAYGFLSRLR